MLIACYICTNVVSRMRSPISHLVSAADQRVLISLAFSFFCPFNYSLVSVFIPKCLLIIHSLFGLLTLQVQPCWVGPLVVLACSPLSVCSLPVVTHPQPVPAPLPSLPIQLHFLLSQRQMFHCQLCFLVSLELPTCRCQAHSQDKIPPICGDVRVTA